MFTCDNCVHRYVCADWVKETHYDKFPLTAETEEELCEFYDEENTIIKYIPSDDKTFIDGVKPDDDCYKILNWYRNLNYKEESNTERGIMANAINELFMDLKNKVAENKFNS